MRQQLFEQTCHGCFVTVRGLKCSFLATSNLTDKFQSWLIRDILFGKKCEGTLLYLLSKKSLPEILEAETFSAVIKEVDEQTDQEKMRPQTRQTRSSSLWGQARPPSLPRLFPRLWLSATCSSQGLTDGLFHDLHDLMVFL